jgi:serine-type D-Ala-D-Ala carboxypeptidase
VTPLPRAAGVLEAAHADQAFSAATAEVGRGSEVLWQYAHGRLAAELTAPPVTSETMFDLASLTKVLATATLAARLVADTRLDLATPIASCLRNWIGEDRRTVTVRDLLEHCSGLPAHRPFFREHSGRAAYAAAIAAEPLEYAPRARAIYSDLGFILLGFVMEDVGGLPLDVQFREWVAAARIRGPVEYCPDPVRAPVIVASGEDRWRGRVLRGEVHDENAAALGGVAAHAGLFGTAGAVGEIARWWLAVLNGASPPGAIPQAIAEAFVTPSTVPGSSRALGWDTMRPTSSCGTRLSSRAVGHTGFTGTSVWLDPVRDLYAVLLTDRVSLSTDTRLMRQIRAAFHDAVVADLAALDVTWP